MRTPLRFIVALCALLVAGCPQGGSSKKSGAQKSGAGPAGVEGAPSAQHANDTARDAASGAAESLKTAPSRVADDAERAASGAAKQLEETPERAERAAEGAKSTAKKATEKGSKLLDKVFDRE